MGYGPGGDKELDTIEVTEHTRMHIYVCVYVCIYIYISLVQLLSCV